MATTLPIYLITAIAFAAIDIVWLMSVGGSLYKTTLGDILADQIRIGPAIAFYLLLPVGLVIFAVAPALKDGTVFTALLYGALFGLFTYGTYELTNFATLRNWTLTITVVDILYGAVLGAVASAIGYFGGPALSRLFSG